MKTLKLTPDMYMHDCISLHRILRRIREDKARTPQVREELVGHLHAVITALQAEMAPKTIK